MRWSSDRGSCHETHVLNALRHHGIGLHTCANVHEHLTTCQQKDKNTRTWRKHFAIGIEVWRVVTELTDTTNHNVYRDAN